MTKIIANGRVDQELAKLYNEGFYEHFVNEYEYARRCPSEFRAEANEIHAQDV